MAKVVPIGPTLSFINRHDFVEIARLPKDKLAAAAMAIQPSIHLSPECRALWEVATAAAEARTKGWSV